VLRACFRACTHPSATVQWLLLGQALSDFNFLQTLQTGIPEGCSLKMMLSKFQFPSHLTFVSTLPGNKVNLTHFHVF